MYTIQGVRGSTVKTSKVQRGLQKGRLITIHQPFTKLIIEFETS